jgi:predicted Zn-dependent peptidase
VIEKQNKPKSLIEYKRTDQTHLSLGVRGYSLFQKERYAQNLLAIILGGNMSSRLFTKIRGERGLAYYVRTIDESFSDSGYLTSQAGVPHKNLGEVIKLILEEYKRVKKEGIKEEELQKAKDYLKGTTVLSMESSDAQASFYGIQALLLNEVLSLEEKFKRIDKVKKKDIESIAQKMFRAQGLNLVVIGPHKNKSNIESLLKI